MKPKRINSRRPAGGVLRGAYAMRCMIGVALLLPLSSGTLYAFSWSLFTQQSVLRNPPQNAQQNAMPGHTGSACTSARSAFTRLVCAEPDLAAVESILIIALRDAKKAATLDDQILLANEQRAWIQEQNQKCDLVGKDNAPVAELRLDKQCLEDAINDRIADLQGGSQTGSIPAASSPPPTQNLIITPDIQPTAPSSGESGSNGAPTFQRLRFSALANGIGGTIECSALPPHQQNDPAAATPLSEKSVVEIAIDDDKNSYQIFEDDSWGSLLDGLRSAAGAACSSALKSGRLRNSANEPIQEVGDAFEAYSPKGLFMAYSDGLTTPWTLQINLPKARKTVKSDLGIQTWLDPSQLARNPYFFKGSVVGMVIQFDHMLSGNDAVFEQSGASVFVSGVSPSLFHNHELVVLAGRVKGNKGLVDSMGSEELLPDLDYLGAYKCGKTCEGF